eukprot:TRINITY_DN12728_c0_g1_i1.p1 TRINITY_DN12728_c0_g1~~TRINITY_DN12728_c0_g1_i1.p1  ORF type:complete len:181 (+),score=39.91 TRINITY_DN12728_c0_g1_i1:211-753(+)
MISNSPHRIFARWNTFAKKTNRPIPIMDEEEVRTAFEIIQILVDKTNEKTGNANPNDDDNDELNSDPESADVLTTDRFEKFSENLRAIDQDLEEYQTLYSESPWSMEAETIRSKMRMFDSCHQLVLETLRGDIDPEILMILDLLRNMMISWTEQLVDISHSVQHTLDMSASSVRCHYSFH